MMSQKTKVVGQLTKGIEMLFKKNKVDYVKGAGKFVKEGVLAVDNGDGKANEIRAKNFIIATGSEPNNLPGGILPIDEKRVVSSTGIIVFYA